MKSERTICLLTGATSGIGKETALELAKRGMKLVLPVRNMEKGEVLKEEIHQITGNGHIDLIECDLASMASIRACAEEFLSKYDRLDVLINNAGIWEMKRALSKDGIEMVFAVNHLAPFLLTNLLLEPIKSTPHSRIINVSSNAHRQGKIHFDDLEGQQGWSTIKAYAQSKLANILFTRRLAHLLEGTSTTVNCLHPGFVNTSLFEKFPRWMMRLASLIMLTPKKGAETTIFLATSPLAGDITGAYFVKKKVKSPSAAAKDNASAKKLWEVSMEYVGPIRTGKRQTESSKDSPVLVQN